MVRIFTLVVVVLLGVAAWKVGGTLSADAVGLSVGVVFGVLAGLPTAILVLAGSRSRGREAGDDDYSRRSYALTDRPTASNPTQPPVIILATPERRIRLTADALEEDQKALIDDLYTSAEAE